MGYGIWSRWGQGSCEGYGLQIGDLIRLGVTASPDRTRWQANLNGTSLGDYDTFDAAIARCEEVADRSMKSALEHWQIFQAAPPAMRHTGRQRK